MTPPVPTIITDYSELPFDRAKAQWEGMNERLAGAGRKERFGIISCEEAAMIRSASSSENPISQLGFYVKEGILYSSKAALMLVKHSPVHENAVEATAQHNLRREYYITQDEYAKAYDSCPFRLATRMDFSIPVNRFAEDDLTYYLFGGYAKTYGEFLNNLGIKEMPFDILDDAMVRAASEDGGHLRGSYG